METPARPHVKICGLSTPDAIEAVIARGGGEIGFVFFEKSPRHLPLDAMARLRETVGDRAGVTVVTVNAEADLLERIAREVRPDTIQFHGSETPEQVGQAKALTGLAAMKAISVASGNDIGRIEAYRGIAERILLDAKAPKGSALPGGNGVSFDWRLLQGLEGPFVLSGGLNAGNVGEAIRVARPAGLDVSSGVESAPGVKDVALIHRLFDTIDAATLSLSERRAS